jgi:hypothetical protein
VPRLSVTAIIREAYNFTLANLGAIIGLIWLPMVLLTVGQFFVNQHYGAQINEAVAAGNPAAAGPAVLAVLFFLLIQLALIAMMMVSVTQLALGQRQGGAMFHFTFGALEWRMFRTLFAAALFLIPPFLLLMLSTGAVMGAAPAAGGPQGVGALLALPLLAGVIYFAVRLMALLFPVVLTEEKSIIVRAWTLTTGNFWRLLGAFLGALLPVYVLTAVALLFVMRDVIPADPGAMPTPEQFAAVQAANLPLITGVQFVVAPLLIGLMVGVSVFSFKALNKTDISA